MLKSVAAFAAVLAATAFVVPTVSNAAEIRSVRVSYADLDLASNAGQQSLERRIYGAAEDVCDIGPSKVELKLAFLAAGCRDDAIAAAQPQFAAAVDAARHGSVTVGAAAALVVTGP